MDIGLFALEDRPDIQFENGDFKIDEGLETEVFISLF